MLFPYRVAWPVASAMWREGVKCVHGGVDVGVDVEEMFAAAG